LDGLSTPAVLHADIACGTHMEPCLKTILEGHRGDIKVIAQALKAEIAFLLHEINVEELLINLKYEIAIDYLGYILLFYFD
jgi:hypothetical protein